MRLAAAAGVVEAERRELYYALLLKDIGCSSNAARLCQIVGGDERAIKAGAKLADWTKPHKAKPETIKLLWGTVLPEAHALRRAARMVYLGVTQHRNNRELITTRCDRGASIVRKLGLGAAAAEAVRSLDEHWDGGGYPEGRKGATIPLFGRILLVAQHLDVFSTSMSPDAAIAVMEERSGTWFDPELVKIAAILHREGRLWKDCLASDAEETTRHEVLELEALWERERRFLEPAQIDQICEAFADVVDAKSPFTFRHSIGVAEAALAIGRGLGMTPERVQFVRRAALLHDLGKLRVPDSILDKQGALTGEEFAVVQEHPLLTRKILERIGAFRGVALIAGQHHEKLDGSGYPGKLGRRDLSLASRVIAVADVYCALTEERPYREALDLDQVARIMNPLAGPKLDADCYEALLASVSRPEQMLPSSLLAASGYSSARMDAI